MLTEALLFLKCNLKMLTNPSPWEYTSDYLQRRKFHCSSSTGTFLTFFSEISCRLVLTKDGSSLSMWLLSQFSSCLQLRMVTSSLKDLVASVWHIYYITTMVLWNKYFMHCGSIMWGQQIWWLKWLFSDYWKGSIYRMVTKE